MDKPKILCGMDPLISSSQQQEYKCGEIYCNYEGVLTFHCVFCPTKVDQSDEFILHYMIHFRDVFEIKQEHSNETSIVPKTMVDDSVRTVKQENIEVNDEILLLSMLDNTECERRQSTRIDSSSRAEGSNQLEGLQMPERKEAKNSVKYREPMNCGICGETFRVKKCFKYHIQSHQTGPEPEYYECEYCGLRLNKKKNLIDHLRRKHGEKVQCLICGKKLRQHYILAHVRRHKNERNFHCTLCDKAFVVAGELTSHLKLHFSDASGKISSVKKFQEPRECNMCDQKFIGKTSYARHIQSHNKTRSLYECDTCGVKIKEKSNLRSHILALHSGLPKIKVPCSICGKIFSRKYLNLHLRKHRVVGQEPSHICPICGKTFIIGDDLSAHIRQHNKIVEKAPCNVCGRKFAIPGPLADHQRVHSGERPFSCQVCGTKFRTKNMLYVHRTIHWTGKNFACEICDMKFKNPSGVRSHRRKVHGKRITSKRRIYESGSQS